MPLIEDFGGLLTDRDRSELPVQRLHALTANNVSFRNTPGSLRLCEGAAALSTTAKPNAYGMGVFSTHPGSAWIMLRDSSGWQLSTDEGATWNEKVHSGYADAYPMFAVEARKLFMVDGYQPYYLTPDETLSEWGPFESPVATASRPIYSNIAGAGLTANARYEVFFTFYDTTTGVESAPSLIIKTGPIPSASAKLRILTGYAVGGGGFMTPPAGADRMRVYVSAADVFGAWYLYSTYDYTGDVGEISLDITAESTGAKYEGFAGPPTDSTILANYASRLWVAGSTGHPTRLWWTEVSNPMLFAGTNYAEVGADDASDEIKGLIEGGTEYPYLVIFKRNSLYRMTGTDDDTFDLNFIGQIEGPISPRAVCARRGVVYWLSRMGIGRYDGQSLDLITNGRIRSTIRTALDGALYPLRCTAVWERHADEVWFAAPVNSGNDPEQIFVYDPKTDEFFVRTQSALDFAYYRRTTTVPLTVILNDTGYVLYAYETTTWNSTAQTATWTSQWLDLRKLENRRWTDRFKLEFARATGKMVVTVTTAKSPTDPIPRSTSVPCWLNKEEHEISLPGSGPFVRVGITGTADFELRNMEF